MTRTLHPARLELLDLLAQGERSVEDLAGAAQMKVSNASAQLRMLAAAGLAASRRDGVSFSARPLDGGLPGWRLAGLPVTAAPAPDAVAKSVRPNGFG